MLQLPVELRRQCLESLTDDAETLKAVRLVNRELGILASEILFRTAILDHIDESAEMFTCLVQSTLNTLVRRIVINTSLDLENSDHYQERTEVLESFGEAIALLCDLPHLEDVAIKFARECACESSADHWLKEVVETTSFRIEVLEFLFAAVRQAENVSSLTIKNLQDHMDKSLFESEDFEAVRNKVTKLHLQIATESDNAAPETSIDKPACHQGFTHDLPRLWLKPLTNQLTHLTLYGAECLWGLWPFVDLREIPPFPHLKSLSLGNYAIALDWQVDWILSHASTLEELLLDDCPIITVLQLEPNQVNVIFPGLRPLVETSPDKTIDPEDHIKTIDLRWHHVLDRFLADLPQLRHFVLGSGDWDEGRAFEGRYETLSSIEDHRYLMSHCAVGPSQWAHNVMFACPRGICEYEDEAVLKTLLKVVEARANAKS